MRLSKAVSRVLLLGLSLLLVALFAPGAKADFIDFACGGSQACTGTVVTNVGPPTSYSTAGIGVSASFETDPFTLIFDTKAGTISFVENNTTEFVGTITNFSGSTDPGTGITTIHLGVNWTTLPSDVSGTQGVTPFPSGSVISISVNNGNAFSVDVPIATPEPASPLLLSSGLLGLGFVVKRKAGSLA